MGAAPPAGDVTSARGPAGSGGRRQPPQLALHRREAPDLVVPPVLAVIARLPDEGGAVARRGVAAEELLDLARVALALRGQEVEEACHVLGIVPRLRHDLGAHAVGLALVVAA